MPGWACGHLFPHETALETKGICAQQTSEGRFQQALAATPRERPCEGLSGLPGASRAAALLAALSEGRGQLGPRRHRHHCGPRSLQNPRS